MVIINVTLILILLYVLNIKSIKYLKLNLLGDGNNESDAEEILWDENINHHVANRVVNFGNKLLNF